MGRTGKANANECFWTESLGFGDTRTQGTGHTAGSCDACNARNDVDQVVAAKYRGQPSDEDLYGDGDQKKRKKTDGLLPGTLVANEVKKSGA